jgi:hypothetical protein
LLLLQHLMDPKFCCLVRLKETNQLPVGDIQIVVTIAGPSEPISVHRKSKVLGIWMNTDTVEVDAAPSFYAVATSSVFHQL